MASKIPGRNLAGAESVSATGSVITADSIRGFQRQGFILIPPDPGDEPRARLLSLSQVFGAVMQHVLSDGDGVVRIEPAPRLAEFGDVFTHRAVRLHTDGAFTATPPRALALQCEQAPGRGGGIRLVDGLSLYACLREAFPDQHPALFDRDAMTIRRKNETATRAVFWHCGDYTQVGFRLDDRVDVSFNPGAAPLVPRIRSFLEDPRNQIRVALRPGEIVVLDNRRMLHGREGFEEDQCRRVNRLWFDGRSTFDIGYGFRTRSAGGNARYSVFADRHANESSC